MRWISLLQKVRDGELNDELMSWIKTSQIDFFFTTWSNVITNGLLLFYKT